MSKFSIKYKLRKGDTYENLVQRFGPNVLADAGIYGDEDLVDIKEEIERLQKEKTKLESEVLRGEKMLSNPGFVNKAPEAKINEEKAKLENYKKMLETVIERLNNLK